MGVFFRRLALGLGGITGGGRLVLWLFAICQTRHSEGERSASARLAQKLPAGYTCLGQCKFILKVQKSGQMRQHCELFTILSVTKWFLIDITIRGQGNRLCTGVSCQPDSGTRPA
jgi:hypothetical protein